MSDYQVFISRKKLDDAGEKTEEVELSLELYRHLTDLGIETFLDDVSLIEKGASRYKREIDDALDSARILVAIGTSRANLESEWVRYEWDSFFNDIISGVKPNGQVVSLVSGIKPAELPRALRQAQCFDYQSGGVAQIGELLVNALNQAETATAKRRSRRREPVRVPTIMNTAVLFVDIAGSTELFDKHGDEIAKRMLSKAVRDWRKITEQNDGWMVKSLGDEIMCGFDTPEDCLLAACEIREEIAIGLRGESIPIRVKIAFSFGTAERTPDGEVVGEAVNLAARIAGLARAGQILTSGPTVQCLDADLQARCEKVGVTTVKWSAEPIAYYEVSASA